MGIITIITILFLGSIAIASINQWNLQHRYENTTYDTFRLRLNLKKTNYSEAVNLNGRVQRLSQPVDTRDYYLESTGNLLTETNGTDDLTQGGGANGCGTPPCYIEVFIDEYKTAPGDLDGWETTGAATNIKFRSKWYKSTPKVQAPTSANFRVKFYHVDSVGGETYQGQYTKQVNQTETTYFESVTVPAMTFGDGEHLSVKLYAYFVDDGAV